MPGFNAKPETTIDLTSIDSKADEPSLELMRKIANEIYTSDPAEHRSPEHDTREASCSPDKSSQYGSPENIAKSVESWSPEEPPEFFSPEKVATSLESQSPEESPQYGSAENVATNVESQSPEEPPQYGSAENVATNVESQSPEESPQYGSAENVATNVASWSPDEPPEFFSPEKVAKSLESRSPEESPQYDSPEKVAKSLESWSPPADRSLDPLIEDLSSFASLQAAPRTKKGLYFLPEATNALPEAESFDVERIRKDFPILQQKVHGKPLVWLDNGATSQKPQAVVDAISHYYERDNSNVHRAAHDLAARATDAYEGARKKVRKFIGAKSDSEIVFLRGATEAINLVAHAYGQAHIKPGDEIVLTTLEHHSNIVPWQLVAEQREAVLRVVPIDERGKIILEEYERILCQRTRIVALSHVSNVLGTVLPVQQMVDMAHSQGAHVLVDGAQAVPHFPVDVCQLGCDFYAFSGHKAFGPTGTGVLYGREHLLRELPPWQGGGSMISDVTFEKNTYADPPHKFEAGTPIIAGAIGLGAAIDYLGKVELPAAAAHEHEVMVYAREALNSISGLTEIGTSPGKVGALSFVIANRDSSQIAKFLNNKGIAVRAGHHCAQPTVRRFGHESVVRASLALYNTKHEIDVLIDALGEAKRALH